MIEEQEITIINDTICIVQYRFNDEQNEVHRGGLVFHETEQVLEILDIVIRDEYTYSEHCQKNAGEVTVRDLAPDKSVYSHFLAMDLIGKIEEAIDLNK
jgi:hypothetical protein